MRIPTRNQEVATFMLLHVYAVSPSQHARSVESGESKLIFKADLFGADLFGAKSATSILGVNRVFLESK